VDRNLQTEPDVNGIDFVKGTVKLGGHRIAHANNGAGRKFQNKSPLLSVGLWAGELLPPFTAYSFHPIEVNGSLADGISYFILASKHSLLEKIL